MELSKFLSGRRKKDENPSATSVPPPPPPAPEHEAPVRPKEAVIAFDDFAAIQSLLEQQGDTVILPLSVLLRSLPPPLQGPEWHDGPLPDGQIILDRESLAAQLKKAKLIYKLADLGGDIPTGWIRGGADTEITLDLRGVVEALPEDFFRLQGQVSPDMIDAATMHDYFAPAARDTAFTPALEQSPRADQRGMKSSARRQTILDANVQTEEELLRIPGISKAAADALVRHRVTRGPYRSIFDVSLVPGLDATALNNLTGLHPGDAQNPTRWSAISSLLQIEPTAPCTLVTILSSLIPLVGGRAAALAAADGTMLAQTPAMSSPGGSSWASLISLMQTAREPLRALQGHPVHALMLPACTPPLLIWASPSFFWMMDCGTEVPAHDRLLRLQSVLLQLDELILPRFMIPIVSPTES